MLQWAVNDQTGPVAIRYPRGTDRMALPSGWNGEDRIVCHRTGKDVAIVTYGTLIQNAMEAAEALAQWNIDASVIRLMTVQPLPAEQLINSLGQCRHVIVLEEVCSGSGIREALAWRLQHALPDCRVDGIDLGHRFVTHGDINSLYCDCGLDAASVAAFVREVLEQ